MLEEATKARRWSFFSLSSNVSTHSAAARFFIPLKLHTWILADTQILFECLTA